MPPPPQPQPQDPALESGALLAGQPAQAFPDQDHDAHIEAHLALVQMGLVALNPMLVGAIAGHVFQHVSFKSQKMAEEQLQQEAMAAYQKQGADLGGQIGMAAQSGQLPVDQAMAQLMAIPTTIQPQMPTPQQIDARKASIQAQLIAEIVPRLSPPSPNQGNDPLVAIRMQELAIKDKEVQNRSEIDQAKLALEDRKLEQRAVSDAARMEVQEQISDDRVQVARERIAANIGQTMMKSTLQGQ